MFKIIRGDPINETFFLFFSSGESVEITKEALFRINEDFAKTDAATIEYRTASDIWLINRKPFQVAFQQLLNKESLDVLKITLDDHRRMIFLMEFANGVLVSVTQNVLLELARQFESGDELIEFKTLKGRQKISKDAFYQAYYLSQNFLT